MQQDFPDAEREQDLQGVVVIFVFYNKKFQTYLKVERTVY